MSRWILLPIVAVFSASAVHLSAADPTVAKTDDSLTFKVGTATAAEYRHAGTVQVEKGSGTKPLAKPYFYPLTAPNGAAVTRGWPLTRGTPGETLDHFHQKSAWFCHGDVIPEGIDMKTRSSDKRVHGVDFWAESAGHGRIVCTQVGDPKTHAGSVRIPTKNEWRTPDGVNILDEDREIVFQSLPAGYLIALNIDLKANTCPVIFGDTKEGSMGVRVNDEFRLNGMGSAGVVTSAEGTVVTAPAKGTLPVWGKPADWHDYSGTVGGKPAGIAIFDHPANAHRSLWHTRDYGLMAANPFGRAGSGFPAAKGNKDLVKLAKGENLKLRYAIYIHDGDAKTGQVAEAFKLFTAGK